MSLSRRVVLLAGLTLLPVVALQAVNEFALRGARETELRASVALQAQQVAAAQERLTEGVRLMLTALSESKDIRNAEPTECTAILRALRTAHPDFEAIGVADRAGNVFCATDRLDTAGPMPPVGDRFYFREAMATGRFTVGTYAVGRRTGVPSFHMAMPYRNPAGETAGVVFVSIGLARLAADLDGPQWSLNRVMTVADRNGTILLRLPDGGRFVGKPFPEDIWRETARASAPGTIDVTSPLDGVRRIVGYIPPAVSPGGLYIGVGLGRAEAFGPLDSATMRGIVGIVVAAAAAMVLAWLFGRRLIARPVNRIIAVTRRWRDGDLSARTAMTGTAEFAQLGSAFDELADDLARAFAYKDVLLRELNHRIMNSLQTVSSLFKLQSRSVTNPEARQQFDLAVSRVNSMAMAYRRMHASDGIESVDFAAFLRELCQDLSQSMLPDGRECAVVADPLLLTPDQAMSLALVVNELVTNAIKHGGAEPAVFVTLAMAEGLCTLSVRNTTPLPPDFRIDGRNGFGMQMVGAMVRQLDGRLDHTAEGGACFTVSFRPKPPQAAAMDGHVDMRGGG